MRKGTQTGLSVGASSILVIFVLLCLTTFATLSLVSANADYKMTARSAQTLAEYYTADLGAQRLLARIDGCLNVEAAGKEAYFNQCRTNLSALPDVAAALEEGGLFLSYQVPVSDARVLEVRLEVLYPAQDGRRYRIAAWRDVNQGQWKEDDSLTLWGGGTLPILG